jgi:hypothetical protein
LKIEEPAVFLLLGNVEAFMMTMELKILFSGIWDNIKRGMMNLLRIVFSGGIPLV